MWGLRGARFKTMVSFVTVAGLSKAQEHLAEPTDPGRGSDGEVHLPLLRAVVGVNLVLSYFDNSTTIAGHGLTTGRSEMGNVGKRMDSLESLCKRKTYNG